jgi:putative transposase
MRGKRFSEEQIIGILKELEAGVKIDDVARKMGVTNTTIYNWKAKYGGLTVSEARRLKVLEDENGKLKRIVADLTLDNQALKAVISKNF